MNSLPPREAWLRGPVTGVPDLLQPVAHALIQAREEVSAVVGTLTDDVLWERPAGVASVGFHLRHLTGVVDRLFTYARGEMLILAQLDALEAERHVPARPISASTLSHAFDEQVERALVQLRATQAADLLEGRVVGRAGLPSTVLGLFVHAAEHAQRHVGQLLVTARFVTNAHRR